MLSNIISDGLNWHWEQHQWNDGAKITHSWQLFHPSQTPSQKCSIAVTGSSVQRCYLIVLEREHYCCWSIEFLNFLHKSSSSRSNLLLPFVQQNFATPIYLPPSFCPTTELLQLLFLFFKLTIHPPPFWSAHNLSSFFSIDPCLGGGRHALAMSEHWGTSSRRNTLSLRMLGLSASAALAVSYAEGDLVEKSARQCKHESSFAIELHSHACAPLLLQQPNWLQKRKRWACQMLQNLLVGLTRKSAGCYSGQ